MTRFWDKEGVEDITYLYLIQAFDTYFPQYCMQVRMPQSEWKANQLDKSLMGWLVSGSVVDGLYAA